MANHPRKLVGVQLAGGKLRNLLQTVRIAAKHLNTEAVSPITAAISRIGTNNIIAIVNRLLPNAQRCQPLLRLHHLSVLEQLPHHIAIVIRLCRLRSLGRVRATRCAKERSARHDERIVFRGRELLIHQRIVLDALSQLPPPPSHLPAVNLKTVELLNVPDPLLFLRGQSSIPICFIYRRLWVCGVKLVSPPTAKDGPLRASFFGRDIHIMEQVEASCCALKHVQPVRVGLSQRSKQRRQTLFIAP